MSNLTRVELNEMDRPALMRLCRESGIKTSPEHTKENLIHLYLDKSASGVTIFSSVDEGSQIKPGYVRILIANSEHGWKTSSTNFSTNVEAAHNGRFYSFVRGKPTDIPVYALSCIQDSHSIRTEEDPDTGKMQMKQVPTYQVSILGYGPEANLVDPGARDPNKTRSLRERQKYMLEHGTYPTDRDLRAARGQPVDMKDLY